MEADDIGNFLSRWSRRKLGREPAAADAPPAEAPAVAAEAPASDVGVPEPAVGAAPAPLPPVEGLTLDSDFTPFMRAEVDPGLKQAAMKQLFKDPHFNVMDGLDTYIDDYSIEDPIPEEMMKKMYQARQFLFTDEEKAAADAAEAAEGAAADAVVEAEAAEDAAALTVGLPPGVPEKKV